MTNGCPKCEKLREKDILAAAYSELCLDCQFEQADADLLKAMNRVEELKQKKKEQENADRLVKQSNRTEPA